MVAILLIVGTVAGALPDHAQAAGATLLVEARDPAGASVPGVLVTLASADTGLERTGVTVDDGTVWIARLPAGAYTLTAVRGGVKNEGIHPHPIQAAARGPITLLMKTGDYTEQGRVEAHATTLRNRDSAVRAGFDPRTLL